MIYIGRLIECTSIAIVNENRTGFASYLQSRKGYEAGRNNESYWHSFLLVVCVVHTTKEAHAIATCWYLVGRLYMGPVCVCVWLISMTQALFHVGRG